MTTEAPALGMETPGYLALADLPLPFDLHDLFGREAPVEMEIGAGRGDFFAGYAARNPHLNLLAVERKLTVIRKAVKKVQRAGLTNAVLLNVEVRHLLQEYVPAGSLQAVHIYFPDPWPKHRHLRRRFVQAENLDALLRAMEPGGLLYFRTDVQDYFEVAMQALHARVELQPYQTPAEILAITTGYEQRFLREGLPIYRAAFQKSLVPAQQG